MTRFEFAEAARRITDPRARDKFAASARYNGREPVIFRTPARLAGRG